MFDIGFPELMLSVVVGLLVIGPERLPEAMRTLGLWLGRMRRSFQSVKAEIEKEIGMDEVRKQLHNEAVMEEMKRIEREVKATSGAVGEAARADTLDPLSPATAKPSSPSFPSPQASPDSAASQGDPQLQGPPVQADSAPAPSQSANTDGR